MDEKTEIRIAQIREREETKRQRTAQREKTKQASGGYWILRGMVVVGAVLAALMVASSYGSYLDATHASNACKETVELITSTSSLRSCAGGGWIETREVSPATVEVHCRCPRPAAPAASSP